jgi:branched-chain amino acid transport system substrate-binding protein
VEQVRKLVEQEGVLLMFQPLGTPPNTAIQKYLNVKKVPQLFVATGATKWGDYKKFPWTMGWQPSYQTEGRAYAKYILQNHPSARIGVLYQNDDYGKDYLHGFKEGLGDKASRMIVKEVSYEITDPTVESQIISLKGSGADLLFNVTTPKFAAQAIRKVAEIGWNPVHFLNSVAANISVFKPAGLENAKGILTTQYVKDASDPQWQSDKVYQEYAAWLTKYVPGANLQDQNYVYGYATAYTMTHVLKQCGDNLTRENVMRQAANLKNLDVPMLLPGIRVNTSPTDYYPIEAVRLAKFNGEKIELFGDLLTTDQ